MSAADLDPNMVASALLDAFHRSVIDPRCDDCGASIPARRTILGPFQCDACAALGEADFQRRLEEFRRAERPDRRVHVVKLPEGFK